MPFFFPGFTDHWLAGFPWIKFKELLGGLGRSPGQDRHKGVVTDREETRLAIAKEP